MDFTLSDEARMLQDGLRRFLRDAYGAGLPPAEEETGYAPEIWRGLAEMGVVGALLPEEAGGLGGTGGDVALVFEEMGRAGAREPLIDTGILGAGLLAALGGADHAPLVERAVAGEAQLAFAHGEPGGRYDPWRVETRAERAGDGWRLTGRKAVVVNAPAADHILVTARTGGAVDGGVDGGVDGAVDGAAGLSLFLVDRGAADLRPYPLVGGGAAAEVTLEATPATLVGPEGGAADAIAAATARATLALSAEALGLMERCKDLTVDYLRTRRQFGRPLGKFQVLQHRMADMLIEIEQARSAVVNLAGHVDAEPAVRDRHVSACKNLVGEAARLVSEESIQMHGGIGLTREYALGHHAQRLVMVDHRFGDALFHLERFIALSAA